MMLRILVRIIAVQVEKRVEPSTMYGRPVRLIQAFLSEWTKDNEAGDPTHQFVRLFDFIRTWRTRRYGPIGLGLAQVAYLQGHQFIPRPDARGDFALLCRVAGLDTKRASDWCRAFDAAVQTGKRGPLLARWIDKNGTVYGLARKPVGEKQR
jgi:hypothetical protein